MASSATRIFLASVFVFALTFGGSLGSSYAQTLTRSQRIEMRAIKRSIDKAEKAFVGGEFDDSGKSIKDAMTKLQKMMGELNKADNADLKKQFSRIKKAHELLTAKGQSLPAMFELKPGKSAAEPDTPETDGISFVKQVAPILNSKCGRCHVGRTSGGFSLANYETLMRGPTAGKVIFEKKPDDSRLIEVIEEGDMPRGGLTVSEAELKTLKTWIAEGAKFDGDNPTQNLARLVGGNDAPRRERIEVKIADKKSKVSFSSEIAPMISERCSGCHLNTQRVRGGLNLANFRGLLRGGDSGNIIKPGDGKGSLLVQRLKGEGGGQRMPAGSPPIDKELIDKIITWIDEGAPYDGGDTEAAVGRLAALAKARNSTHDELAAERKKIAERNWKMVMSGSDFESIETDNFLLLGEFDKETLTEFGKLAEDHAKKITPILKMDRGDQFIKGRMTVFLFKRRYDYSEFGKMVERRELPRGFKGHWGYTTIDGYAAILVGRNDSSETVSPTLAQQIAAVAMASAGTDVPKWFSDGVGFWASAKIHARDEVVKEWRTDSVKYAESMQRTDDFIRGVLPDDQAALVSFYFVDLLNKSASRIGKLMSGLKKGEAFETAFEQAWGRKPSDMLNQAAGRGNQGNGKRKNRRKK